MGCWIFHNWYYGDFQTGKRSEYTGDHIGIFGRVCKDCGKRQVRDLAKTPCDKKYRDVTSFEGVRL